MLPATPHGPPKNLPPTKGVRPEKAIEARRAQAGKPRAKPSEILARINLIRRLRKDGKPDSEIIAEIGISASTYYKVYLPKLYKLDKEVLKSLSTSYIEHEYLVLRDRLLTVLTRANEIASDSDASPGARNDANRLYMETAINIFRLAKDGPSVISVKIAKDAESRVKGLEKPRQEAPTDLDIQIAKANNLVGKLPGYPATDSVSSGKSDQGGDRTTPPTTDMPEE